jgi:cation diffusion facilitator CzcD-associated flavoprotein CzcO
MKAARGAEHLDVLVVGAGLSGVAAGHYLRTSCPWARFAIFEARGTIGGTWDLFRYPGVRSDSDMFTLGYSFRPWDGDRAIADGEAICRYIRETAAAEGLDAHIRFHHRVRRAEWSATRGAWNVVVERTDTGETVEVTCGFLFFCSGYYRYDRGHLPDFPGMADYRGRLVHPQDWPAGLDLAGKRVVVIGSGATAITLVPALAGRAAHVTMLQRSPSYVLALPARSPALGLLRRVLPGRGGDGAARWLGALASQGFYQFCRRHPSAARRLLLRGVARRLPPDVPLDPHFTPRYDPWDQRLCIAPDGDFFAAIRSGRASVVTDVIERFTASGVALASGAELVADVIVCATGLELLFLGGCELVVDGEPLDPAARLAYKGLMLEGVPNLAVAIGYTNASWTLRCELTCEYVCRLLNHMRATGTRWCVPVNSDPAVQPEPLLPLRPGYILRAADRLPKQGSRFPWRTHQSFLRDYWALRLGPLDDGVLAFVGPAPATAARAP